MNPVHIDKLDLNLLRTLQAIHAEGSVTRAAVRLHQTQSAISHALRRLRDVLGDPLFVRQGSALVATPFTRNVMGPLQASLRAMENALNAAARFDPSTALRRFVVGMDERLEVYALPAFVNKILNSGPGLEFSSIRLQQDSLEDSLASGRVDAAILAASFHNPDLRRSLMARDGLVVLARQDHPIVRGRSLTLNRYLASEHIAVIGDSTHPIEEDVALSRAGQARRVRIRTQRYVAAMAIVAESDLLVTMPRFYALVVNRYTRNRMVPFPVRTDPIKY